MNKAVIGFVLFIILAGGAVLIAGNSGDTDDPVATTQNAESKSEDDSHDDDDHETEATFTAAEVATHNNEADCWTIIDEHVYDITEYIPRHPGGSEILRACGADGTSLFQQRTTEDGQTVGSGTPHSSNASAQLASFEIGHLATN